MNRHAAMAERDRAIAAAARVTDPDRRAARRLRFIRVERLSLAETADLPIAFDPGAEYDLSEHLETAP